MKYLPEIRADNARAATPPKRKPKPKTVRVQLHVQMWAHAEVEMPADLAKELDAMIDASKTREAFERLDGSVLEQVLQMVDGELEDLDFIKGKKR